MCTLSGHLGPLTAAEFCPWDEEIVATTSEDRTFKVILKPTYLKQPISDDIILTEHNVVFSYRCGI